MGGALALIPTALGVASQLGLFGKGAKEGKKVEYEAQAPEYQQQFAEEFFKYLQGQIGQGATPYGGQVAAPFQNPFTQGAFGAMQASPYGSMMGNLPMGGMPFVPPQQPPQQPAQGGTRAGQGPFAAMISHLLGGRIPPGMAAGLSTRRGQAQTPQQSIAPRQRPAPQRSLPRERRRGVPFQR